MEKKEIVFVPYKPSLWAGMNSVWRSASRDQDADVYVIPAPYYYKDAYGRVKTEDPHYEMEGYPKEVTLTSYEEYDFQKRHPDMIVIQCPYDEYHYGMTVHPFFYAKNLTQYTDKLVYIPAFVMDEIGSEDDRARETLKSYCNTPGVVYADTVIVQSEQMKDVYVELLTEFAGKETKSIWEKKILGLGSPVHDQKAVSSEDMELPDDWLSVIEKSDGSRKRVVLYKTSISALLHYADKMITKMMEIFETFLLCQEEMILIWCPDFENHELLCKIYPDLFEKYDQLVQRYQKESWGIYCDSADYSKAIELCDACIGDSGSVLNQCRDQGKVVKIIRL